MQEKSGQPQDELSSMLEMAASEFCKRYIKTKDHDGILRPFTISDYDSAIMDAAAEAHCPPWIMLHGRGGQKIIVNPAIKNRVTELLNERTKRHA